jgi:hypothetical protein
VAQLGERLRLAEEHGSHSPASQLPFKLELGGQGFAQLLEERGHGPKGSAQCSDRCSRPPLGSKSKRPREFRGRNDFHPTVAYCTVAVNFIPSAW